MREAASAWAAAARGSVAAARPKQQQHRQEQQQPLSPAPPAPPPPAGSSSTWPKRGPPRAGVALRQMRLLPALALAALPLSLRACPPITPEGTIPGTCDVGSPGCQQGPQCQSRAENAFMPTYHLLGNFTEGVGTQPIAVNDVSAVVHYRGVWHVFHQFGQCGWAHAVSSDGARWKNLRYPLTPDNSSAHSFDAKGAYDGSVTIDPEVNSGRPIILYDTINLTRTPYSTPRRACGAGGWDSPSVPSGESEPSEVGLGDAQTMGVATPVDYDDLLLEYWQKDGPIEFHGKGTCFPSQIFKSGDHWNFIADGERWETDDPSFRSWTAIDPGSALNGSEGWPTGGNGGEWVVPLPRTVSGEPPPPGSPNRVVSVRSGNQYLLGTYDPAKERFVVAEGEAACQCCPIPPNCTADEAHELDHGYSFTWGALQQTAGRTMNSGWVVGIAARGDHASHLSGANGANRNPPGSAISLTREITYDPSTRKLRANPMPELVLLRNDTLFNASSLQLRPGGQPTRLPLSPASAGDTVDVTVSYVLGTHGAIRTGVSVLANADNISESTVVRLEVGLPDANGVRRGSASGRVELAEGDCPWSNWWECTHPQCIANRSASGQCPSYQRARAARPADLLWNASFALAEGAESVDVRLLVDRSIVEVFVAGGQVAALVAYEPKSVAMTSLHVFGEEEEEEDLSSRGEGEKSRVVEARDVRVYSMSCGWVE